MLTRCDWGQGLGELLPLVPFHDLRLSGLAFFACPDSCWRLAPRVLLGRKDGLYSSYNDGSAVVQRDVQRRGFVEKVGADLGVKARFKVVRVSS